MGQEKGKPREGRREGRNGGMREGRDGRMREGLAQSRLSMAL